MIHVPSETEATAGPGRPTGEEERVRVGIVGAGIAGTSLAYFLRESLGADADVVVFEGDPAVGGRIQDVTVGGRTVEVGGKIIHTRNRYLRSFVDELGLETRDISELSEQRLGVWDGESFAFRTVDRGWLTVLKMLGRYGFSLRSARSLTSDVVERIDRLYDDLGSGTGYATPNEMVGFLGLDDLIRRSGYEHLESEGLSNRFVREFVNGAARSIYAQDASMHALACLVVMAAVEQVGSTFAVEGGNVQLCRELLEEADADVRTGTPVRRVARRAGPGPRPSYVVETVDEDTCGEAFDAVCIATPLELAEIELDDIEVPPEATSREYLTVRVTVVVGRVDPRYFGEEDRDGVPGFVVTEEGSDDPFMFLLKRDEIRDGEDAIYQLWNRERVPEERLAEPFSSVSETRQVTWEAFPRLTPGAEMPPFRIEPGCYYVNAMESIASAMEIQAIGSRNVANLLADDLAGATPGTSAPGSQGG